MKRNNIPAELRALPQWVVSNENKIPHNPRTGATASVVNPATWGTFEEACKAPNFKHIGFVLADHNNITIIDLDDKPDRPASPEQKELQKRILAEFQSYTERSQSGTGYHIIVRGHIPAGVHKDSIEIYSSGRYMICTGDVTKQLPVNNYQGHLDNMFLQMRPQEDVTLVQVDSEVSDADIVDMATSASNGEKFTSLCKGDTTGYPGQSEADLAVMSILAFYTKDNEQVMRIFRMTELGKRDKATRNDKYLTYTLKRIRANEAPPLDFPAIALQAKAAREAPPEPQLISAKHAPIALPPGLVGEVAQYLYQSSFLPIQEVALATSLAFLGGLCGREYNTHTGLGLNQYIVVLAETGRGKDGASEGLGQLFNAIRTRIPAIDQYRGDGSYSSKPALHKALFEKPCHVALFGEYGKLLRRINGSGANTADQSLVECLLDIYGKSGRNGGIQGMRYSDNDKNVGAVISPSFTMLGETTPEIFLETLDESMVVSGYIPRHIILNYIGDRPRRNRNPGFPPDAQLLNKLCKVAETAMRMAANRSGSIGSGVQKVAIDQQAEAMDDAFEEEARSAINKSATSQVHKAIWTRAHAKCLKLASLLAVGVDPINPMITKELYQWAENLTRVDIHFIEGKFSTGSIGQGDDKRQQLLMDILTKYPQAGRDPQCPALPKLQASGIIPWTHIQRRLTNKAFTEHKLGANLAGKATIQNLVDLGVIQVVPAADLSKNFGYRGLAYAILSKTGG